MQASEGRVLRFFRALPQRAMRLVYPAQCLCCDTLVNDDFGLCGPCWRETPFIAGLVCDCCGLPLPGQDPGHRVICDDCLAEPRPWQQGRAAMLYRDRGRDLVLQLKHSDRLDLAKPAAQWLLRAAKPLLRPDALVAPIPLHWRKILLRRYNQASVLSGGLAGLAQLDHCPDLLWRPRKTASQEGKDHNQRFANQEGAIAVHPRCLAKVRGRAIVLVDDVMTSGATLSAAAQACLAQGAAQISVVVLCRVAKGD